MTTAVFIPESEAATRAGVSSKTLERFAEAGYLRRAEQQGHIGFWADELSATFGIQIDTTSQTFEPPPITPPSVEQEVGESCHMTREEAPYQAAPEAQPAKAPESVSATPASTTTIDSTTIHPDVVRLSHVVALQEKLLEKLEEENKELKAERSWLRLRVEKFEEKGERDQLLLLSERQLLRTLTGAQRRSPIQTALEWLGFKTSQEAQPLLVAHDVTENNQNPTETKKAA